MKVDWPASQLETLLRASLGEPKPIILRRDQLPTDAELNAVHAELARLVRGDWRRTG